MSSSARVAPASAVAAAVVAVVAEAAVVVVQGLASSQIAAQGASYGRTAKQGSDIMKESSFGEHQPRLFTAHTHTRARTPSARALQLCSNYYTNLAWAHGR